MFYDGTLCHVGPGLQSSQEETRPRARERGAHSRNRTGAQCVPGARISLLAKFISLLVE
jgi:hypothetical protein